MRSQLNRKRVQNDRKGPIYLRIVSSFSMVVRETRCVTIAFLKPFIFPSLDALCLLHSLKLLFSFYAQIFKHIFRYEFWHIAIEDEDWFILVHGLPI